MPSMSNFSLLWNLYCLLCIILFLIPHITQYMSACAVAEVVPVLISNKSMYVLSSYWLIILKERIETDYWERSIFKAYGLATKSEGNHISICLPSPQWQIHCLSRWQLQWSSKAKEVLPYRESICVLIHLHTLLRKIILSHPFLAFQKTIILCVILQFSALNLQFLSKRPLRTCNTIIMAVISWP